MCKKCISSVKDMSNRIFLMFPEFNFRVHTIEDPVTVEDRAYTAAGSTVTDDVPEGALAIARQRQTNIRGWADRLRKTWKK